MTEDLILTRASTIEGSLDTEKRYREFVASTTTIDAHGSIIKQNWRLDRYSSNPVVLRDHDSRRPIGTGAARVEDGELVIGITFARNDEEAEKAWNLVSQDVLRAVSVGFRYADYEVVETPDDWIIVYDSPELFEVSVVAVPSNPDALARACAASSEAEEKIRRAALARRKERHMAGEKKEPGTLPEERAGKPETITRAEHDVALAKSDKTVEELRAQLETERSARLATEIAVEKLETSRRETKLVQLAGDRLTEAQIGTEEADESGFRELLKSNERLFDKIVKSLPKIGGATALAGRSAVGKDPPTERGKPLDGKDLDRALLSRVEERMKTFGETRQKATSGAMQDLKDKGQLA